MLKEKKKVLIVVLLVVSSFMSGIFFSNYMTELEYERLLLELEELESEESTECLLVVFVAVAFCECLEYLPARGAKLSFAGTFGSFSGELSSPCQTCSNHKWSLGPGRLSVLSDFRKFR